LFRSFRRNARPVVRDLNVQHWLTDEYTDGDFAAALHVLDRVIQIVDERPTDQTRISLYRWYWLVEFHADFNALFFDDRANRGDDFIHQLTYVDIHQADVVALFDMFEVEQVVNQVLQAVNTCMRDADNLQRGGVGRVYHRAQ